MSKRKTFRGVDQKSFNQFLESIGLVEKDTLSGEVHPLAELRGSCSKHYLDARLYIEPKDAASMVRKTTGLKCTYIRDGSTQYWTFTVPHRGIFTFELYKGCSTYMTMEHDPKAYGI